ncbi:alpha-galactosidase [Brachybacterium hainanense]|uniref:alpha-galactosidase n=1 Tax=Brachybacterium hainanense TaxID=1541174 RepID=A0ABV6RFJ3_9MICO
MPSRTAAAHLAVTSPAPGLTHRLHLRAAGVSVLLDVTDGRVPAIVHWGGDLGPLSPAEIDEVALAGIPSTPLNAVDVPVRIAILPQSADGWIGRPGIIGSRLDGAGFAPRLAVTGIRRADVTGPGTSERAELAGPPEPLRARQLEAGPSRVEVDLADAELGLAATLEIELLPSGLLRQRASLTNRDESPYQLQELTVSVPVPGDAAELLDFAGRWAKERTPQRRGFEVGTHLRENRRGRTGADSAYVLHAGTPGFGFQEGEIWAVHTAFSGNHRHLAERSSSGHQILGGGELLLPGEAVLAREESYRGPWLYASHGHGLDAVAARFHTHLRSRAHHVDTRRPVTLNVWEAVYFDHDLDRLRDLADRAAALGVERYVLDDGWFGSRRDDTSGLGDWVESADVWPMPEGLAPLVDHVTGLGMQFGLWFEPEMISEDSEVARAHPEWIMAPSPDRLPLRSRSQQVMNLSIPGAYAHVRGQMQAILDRYDIAYLKWDHNRDLIEAATRDSGIPAVHAQTEAFYRLVDELKRDNPGLEIESCSSGGARIDLEVLERTDRVWVSDCIDPLDRQQMNRWTSQLVPLELMGSHIASGRSHTTGRLHSLDFRAATALLGHLGIEWDLATATPEETAALRRWITLYTERRELLFTGRLVRVDRGEDVLWVHGVVSPDRERALFEAASMTRSGEAQPARLRLAGLDPERRYRVQVLLGGDRPSGLRAPAWMERALAGEEVVLPGAALLRSGLDAPVLDPEQAFLLELTPHEASAS